MRSRYLQWIWKLNCHILYEKLYPSSQNKCPTIRLQPLYPSQINALPSGCSHYIPPKTNALPSGCSHYIPPKNKCPTIRLKPSMLWYHSRLSFALFDIEWSTFCHYVIRYSDDVTSGSTNTLSVTVIDRAMSVACGRDDLNWYYWWARLVTLIGDVLVDGTVFTINVVYHRLTDLSVVIIPVGYVCIITGGLSHSRSQSRHHCHTSARLVLIVATFKW